MVNVVLRALEPSDIEQILTWENNPEHWKFGPRYAPFSRDTMRQYLEAAKRDFWEVGQMRWMIEDAKATPLGLIDIYDAQPIHQHASVGLLIDPEMRGRGIGTAALQALQQWAVQHALIRSLRAEMLSVNHAARSTFAAAGYREVGNLKGWYHLADGWHDVVIMQWNRGS